MSAIVAASAGGSSIEALDGSSSIPPSPAPLARQLEHWAEELKQIEAERAKMDDANAIVANGSRRHSRNGSRRQSGEHDAEAANNVRLGTAASNPPPTAAGGAYGPRAPPPTGMTRPSALSSLRQSDVALALAGVALSRDGDSAPSSERSRLHSGGGGGGGRPRSRSSGEPSPLSSSSAISGRFGRVYREQPDRLVLEGSDEDDDEPFAVMSAAAAARPAAPHHRGAGGLADVRESPVREAETLREREQRREHALRREPRSHQSPAKPERPFHLQHLPHAGSLQPTHLLFTSAEDGVGIGELHTHHLPSLEASSSQGRRRTAGAPPPTAALGGRSPTAPAAASLSSGVQPQHQLLAALTIDAPTARESLAAARSGAGSRRQSSGGLGPTIALPLNSLRPANLLPLPAGMGMNGDRTPSSGGWSESSAMSGGSGSAIAPLSGGGLSSLNGVGRATGPSSGSSTPVLRPSRRAQANQQLAPLAASHTLQAQQLLQEGEGSVLIEPRGGGNGGGSGARVVASSASNSRTHSPSRGTLRALGAGSRRFSADQHSSVNGLPRIVDELPSMPNFEPNVAAAAAIAQAAQPHSLSSLAAARAQRRRSVEQLGSMTMSQLAQQSQLSEQQAAPSGSHYRAHPLSSSTAASNTSGHPSAAGSTHSSRPTTPFSNEAAFAQVSKRRSLPPLGLAGIGEQLNEHAA